MFNSKIIIFKYECSENNPFGLGFVKIEISFNINTMKNATPAIIYTRARKNNQFILFLIIINSSRNVKIEKNIIYVTNNLQLVSNLIAIYTGNH